VLFGFQLMAVFNARFEGLSQRLQDIHLAALVAAALTVALIMTPAAYHRKIHPHHVTEKLLSVTTCFVNAALVPLTLGLALDLYVVTWTITASTLVALVVACFALGMHLSLVPLSAHAGRDRLMSGQSSVCATFLQPVMTCFE